MFTLPVFQLLLQDNPDLFTTEGLSSLLLDSQGLKCTQHHKFTYPSLLRDKSVYLELAQWGDSNALDAEIIRRFKASPKIWAANGCETVQESSDFLFLFGKIRDNLHELQRSIGISGVSHHNTAIRVRPWRWRSHRLFSYPAVKEQLILLDSDRLKFQQSVREITKYFISLVQMRTAYNLFSVDENEKKIPASATAVQKAASKAVRADIYATSHDWQQTGANCWEGKRAYKVDPDEIHLCLHLDWDENEFIFFDAHHPDPKRCPWLDTAE
ncbi:hypothetical protein COO91_10596 (plasmid) [Nostoc flagelliforme CCNUN1]|uniref:Uncharacterized protein n=1 Tax=Nostoc flagelliforme CCNUN1 TaxID=2038116 RepID=A0A2K8T9W0_9NOSO|nr:hypothetical protein [Nostoc flagelliforme]AUB44373.1 hypothetical protein COO91_10596 [Nostoc flagelliforme CCNUN1]